MDPSPSRPSEELERLVRAVLSAEDGKRTPLKHFEETYRRRTGETFPWQELRYASASECLEMMSDICSIEKLTDSSRTGSSLEELFVVLNVDSVSSGDNPNANVPTSVKKELPCQDVRVTSKRKISEGSNASGLSDSARPSTPGAYVVLSFRQADNPHLTSAVVRVMIYPHGLRDLKVKDGRFFLYFRDYDTALKVSNGEFLEINGCRFEEEPLRIKDSALKTDSLRTKNPPQNLMQRKLGWQFFSLSFPLPANPDLRSPRAVRERLRPYGLRQVNFYGNRCFIRFDNKTAAMKLFDAPTGILGLCVAEREHPVRAATSMEATKSEKRRDETGDSAATHEIEPSPAASARTSTATAEVICSKVEPILSPQTGHLEAPEDSSLDRTGTFKEETDAAITCAVAPRTVSAVLRNGTPSRSSDVTLMYHARDNPRLANSAAIQNYFDPLGLQDFNLLKGWVFIRFKTCEEANEIFKIEPPIVGLKFPWNRTNVLSRRGPLPFAHHPNTIPTQSAILAENRRNDTDTESSAANLHEGREVCVVPAINDQFSSSKIDQKHSVVSKSSNESRPSRTLMYNARGNPKIADRVAIRYHFDPLGLISVNFHRDWVFIHFETEWQAKKIFDFKPPIVGLMVPYTRHRDASRPHRAVLPEGSRKPADAFQSASNELHEGRELSVSPKSEAVVTGTKFGILPSETDHNHNAVFESSIESSPKPTDTSRTAIVEFESPTPALHDSQDISMLEQSLSSLNTSAEPSSSTSKVFNSSVASESSANCSAAYAHASKSTADLNQPISSVNFGASPTSIALSKANSSHRSSPRLHSPLASSPRGRVTTKPQIEQFLSKESITEMSVHFLKALPRLTACPFTDQEIAEMLVNATKKSSEKVVNARVTSLLRRVDAPGQGEHSVRVDAVVRVKIIGSKEAFLERLWDVCCTNIPPLVEEMVPLFLHPADDDAPERMKTVPGFSLTSQIPLSKSKGNARTLWKIFTMEQKDGDQDEEALLNRMLEVGNLSDGLDVRSMETGNRGRPALILLSAPPMSRACDLVLVQLRQEEKLAKLTQIWEGVSEKSATEALYEFKMTYGTEEMFMGLSSVSLASGNDDGFPFQSIDPVPPILNMSNSEVDALCQSSAGSRDVDEVYRGIARDMANDDLAETYLHFASDAAERNSAAAILNPDVSLSSDGPGQNQTLDSASDAQAELRTEEIVDDRVRENEPIVNLVEVLSKQDGEFLQFDTENTVTSYHLEAGKQPCPTIVNELTTANFGEKFPQSQDVPLRAETISGETNKYLKVNPQESNTTNGENCGRICPVDSKADARVEHSRILDANDPTDPSSLELSKKSGNRASESSSKTKIPDLYFQPHPTVSRSDIAVPEDCADDADEGAVEQSLAEMYPSSTLEESHSAKAKPRKSFTYADYAEVNLIQVGGHDFSSSLTALRRRCERQCVSVSTSRASMDDCEMQQNVCEVVSVLRDKTVRWGGDIIPRQKTNLLSCETAKSVPTTMTTIFLDEIARAYGDWFSFQHLPQMMNIAIHEVEDGRRFWGQVAQEESLAALWKIHDILREAAKVLGLTNKPPPNHGKCMARFGKYQWYRGFISKTHCDEDRRPNLFEVFFVDFGFCRQVNICDVAELPLGVQEPMLPFLPPLALPFQLHGLQGMLKNRGKERLSSLILNRIVPCRVLPSTADSNPRTLPKFSNNPHLFNAQVFLNEESVDSVNDIMRI